MKKVFKTVSLLLVSASLCGNVFAADDTTLSEMATIRGRVIDGEKNILPGASIYVENLKTGTVSDIDGFYTLSNLKPGTYTVKISYVGYDPITLTLEVPNGKTVEKDIVMHEGVVLQEVEVKGAFTGQRKALSVQKNSMGIKNATCIK